MNPTSANIGTYTITITFSLSSDATVFKTQSFLVEVYPEIEYNKRGTETECAGNIYPMRLGEFNNLMYTDGNIDSTGSTFISCGSTLTLNNPSGTYTNSFLISFSKSWKPYFWLTFELGTSNSSAHYCMFGENDNIYIAMRSSSITSTINQAYLFKYTNSGKLINAKVLDAQGKSMFINYYVIDQSTGSQYATFETNEPTFFVSGIQGAFLLILDRDFNIMQSLAYSFASSYNLMWNIAIDQTNKAIYSVIGNYQSGISFTYGVMKANLESGQPNWAKILYNGSSTTRVLTIHQGLVCDSNFVYSLFAYYHYNGVSGYEVYLNKHTSTGVLNSKVEFTVPLQPKAMDMILSTSRSQIIVNIAYYAKSEIYVFSQSSPITLIQSLLIVQFPNFDFDYARIVENGDYIYGFNRAKANNLSDQWIYRFKDTINVTWDNPCTYLNLQIQQTSSTFFTSLNISGNGINGDSSLQWVSITPTYSSIPWNKLKNFYNNPIKTRIFAVTNSSINLKTSYGTCSVYASPSAPQIANRNGKSTNGTGGFVVGSQSYTLIVPLFTQCQDIALQANASISPSTPLPSFISFNNDSTNPIFTITPNSNQFKGNYTIRYQASFQIAVALSNFSDFQIEIIGNNPPYVLETFNKSVQLYSYHSYNWTIALDNDHEQDIASFYAELVDASTNITLQPQPSWFLIEQSDQQGIIFSVNSPSQPLIGNFTLYYINVTVWDQWNDITPNYYIISLNLTVNQKPYLQEPINQTLPSFNLPGSFSFTLWLQNLTDDEGDQIILDCSTNTTTSLIGSSWTYSNFNSSTGNMTIYGTTLVDNKYAGIYVFNCTVTDEFPGSPNFYEINLEILPKLPLTVSGNIANQSIRLPQSLNISYSSLYNDPSGQPVTKALYVNDILYTNQNATWFNWNSTSDFIHIKPNNNNQKGNYSIAIKLDDMVTASQYINFTVEIIENLPLIALDQIPQLTAIVNNPFIYHFNKSKLFVNPEGEPFTMIFRSRLGNQLLPYFISNIFQNGTLSGYTTLNDIGVYELECVGIDDANWETSIPFQLLECLDECIPGFVPNQKTRICEKCPLNCKMCFGADPYSECTKCQNGYFFINNGCFEECPKGYYGDSTDNICKKCHYACRQCFGKSSFECTECEEIYGLNEFNKMEKKGFLQVQNECKIPKCPDGTYFQWNLTINGKLSAQCDNCDPSCKKCVGPNKNDCLQCQLGYQKQSDNRCIKCEDIPGYFTNEEFDCEEICGDGKIYEKQCDDGNQFDGDGCSSKCQIEFGYACPKANESCIENIEPFFKIITNTPSGKYFVEFSENVNLTSTQSISTDNIIVELIGHKNEYLFDWKIDDPSNLLLPNREIHKFQFRMYNLRQSLTGDEIIRVSVKDNSMIKDLAGNFYKNGSYIQIHPYPYDFLTQEEQTIVKTGGSSLKYSILCVFSVNMSFKVIINSTMQYVWGLVHALQLLNYLLFMNINYPENLNIFEGYLKVASGNVQELNDFIPNLTSYLIDFNELSDTYDSSELPKIFVSRGITPYFVQTFGQKLTMWIIGWLGVVPLAFIFHKLSKRFTIANKVLGLFFFNLPLRALIEMYIEIVIQVILNTKFIKFGNKSQTFATIIAFIFGVLTLLLPFMSMSAIYLNRRNIKKSHWRRRFGMLTDEFRQQSILQAYYYPLFMFQRLFIACVIVYLFDYPLIQCCMVMTSNILMIAYLVIVRPFKEEIQQLITILDELIIIVCIIIFLVLEAVKVKEEDKLKIGWAIIILVFLSVFKNVSVAIYKGFKKTKKRFLKIIDPNDERQKETTNSSENGETLVSSQQVQTLEVMKEIQKEETFNNWTESVMRTPKRNSSNEKLISSYRKESTQNMHQISLFGENSPTASAIQNFQRSRQVVHQKSLFAQTMTLNARKSSLFKFTPVKRLSN